MQALLHDLKVEAWPLAPYVDHWRAEAVRACDDAADDFTESMRGKIDLAAIYRRGWRHHPRCPREIPRTDLAQFSTLAGSPCPARPARSPR